MTTQGEVDLSQLGREKRRCDNSRHHRPRQHGASPKASLAHLVGRASRYATDIAVQANMGTSDALTYFPNAK